MNTLFLPILAQAGAVAADGTNNVAPLIKPDRTILKKFEDATGLPPEVAVWGVNIAAAATVLIVGYIVAGIARNMVRRLLAKRHIDQTVGDFLGNLVHAGIMTFVVITALGQLGVDTKTFAAVIAAAGLAIGLALQGGLSNFAAGFLIVVFRPFRKGDVVSAAGIEGTVEEVQVFSTTLHTADNKKIIVPNNSIMGGTITNYTANPVRRIDGGTQIELHAWCKTPEYGAVSSDLIAKAPGALAAAGIKGPDKSVVFVERK